MITKLIAVALIALCVGACGGTSTTPKATSAPSQQAIEQAVDTAKVACAVPRKQFAADFGLTSTSPTVLAHRYARAYDNRMRAKVAAACLRAMTR